MERKVIHRDTANRNSIWLIWYRREQRDNQWFGKFIIEYNLRTEGPDYAGAQGPNKWSIHWTQHLDYLASELPQYLRRSFPGELEEVLDALKQLDPAFN